MEIFSRNPPWPHIKQAPANTEARSKERTGDIDIQPAMEPGIQQRRIFRAGDLDVPDVLIQIEVLVRCRGEGGKDAVLA